MGFLRYGFKSFLISLGFAVFFAIMAVMVVQNKASRFDLFIINNVQSMELPYLTTIAKGLSFAGSSQLAIEISFITMAALFIILKHRMELILFVWVGLGSQYLNTYFKNYFHRVRPNIHRLVEQGGYSFPSGHSMAAFSLYGVVTYLLWRHIRSRIGRIFLIMATLLITCGIGWSRIYLGVHYPSDVMGGYAASGAWLMLSIALFQIYRGNQKAPS